MSNYDFRWNDWNFDKIARHGVSVEEVEYVVAARAAAVSEED